MTLGDGELAHADQAVHLTGGFVAEECGGLVIAQGQVAVGALLVEVCLILKRTGHRTKRVDVILRVGIAEDEHAVLVVIPVSADLIQIGFCHKRRFCQQPAALLLLVLHKALQELDHSGALGKQDRQALSDVIDGGKKA